MENNTLTTSTFQLLDIFMDKYNCYYSNEKNTKTTKDNNTNSDDEDIDTEFIKNDCINYTKQLHEYLIEKCNFILISRDLDKFIDKHIDTSQDLNFVMIAIGYLFPNSFFEIILNTKYESIPPYIKNVFHINLSQILFNKIVLAQKYVDDEIDIDDRKEILEYLISDDINMLKKIFLDIKGMPELQKSKEDLMEYLCQHDLEDIYSDETVLIENSDSE